jgi:hypothetical protein
MIDQILTILRDPVWQFIGAILAFLAIIVSAIIYYFQRQKRELAFGLLRSRRVVAISDEVSSRVSVHLDGHPVSNVHLLEFGLKNSGQQAISTKDFEQDMVLLFPMGCSILSVDIVRKNPHDLATVTGFKENSVFVQPHLLNAGDFAVIQVLASMQAPSFTTSVRITGISHLVPINTGFRVQPLQFFPFSHPLNGAPMYLYGALTGLLIVWRQTGDTSVIYGGLSLIVFLILFSISHWYLGERGKGAGRYINEAQTVT